MYNEELKRKFLKEYTKSESTAQVCKVTFEAFEPYEVEWDADLCTRSAEILQPVVDELSGLRTRTKWTRLMVLKDYVKWCLAQGVEGACNGMLEINTTGLDKVILETVSSPRQLQKFLDEVCLPESEQATDNIYRCFYWLAFMGLPEEHILNVRVSDVDFETLTVRYANREFPMYRESLPAFKNCVTLTQFKFVHPNYGADKIIYNDRVDGDILIRGVRQIASSKTIRVELSRRNAKALAKNHTTKKLSYLRVWMSGLFYDMYERERAGEPVDFISAAREFTKGKRYKLESGRNSQESKVRRVARDYEEDYRRWKIAYML